MLLLLALTLAAAAPPLDTDPRVLAADGWLDEARQEFLLGEQTADNLMGAATLAVLLDADLPAARELRLAASELSERPLPPLALMHRDEHVMFHGAGSAIWMAALPTDNPSALHMALGSQLVETGLVEEARRHFARAAMSHEVEAWALALMPRVFHSEEHAAAMHAEISEQLRLAVRRAERVDSFAEYPLPDAVYAQAGARSDRQLLTYLAHTYIALYPPLLETSALLARGPVPLRHGRPLRVGFVSRHFRASHVCRLLCGVMRELDRARFEVVVFNPSEHWDRYTNVALSGNATRVPLDDVSLASRQVAMDRDLDVLVFGDVDAQARMWAFGRVAPVQVAVWSPSSTGLPNVDYFVTGERQSAHLPDADARFSEQLVRLAGLAAYVFHPRVDGREKPLPPSVVVSGGSRPFVAMPDDIEHWHPAFDAAAAAVAAQGVDIVVAYRNTLWLRALQRRLPAEVWERVVPVRNLQGSRRLAVVARAVAVLDPFPWGADEAAHDALFQCTPVIAAPALQPAPALAAGFAWARVDTPEGFGSAVAGLLRSPVSRESVCALSEGLIKSEEVVKSWEEFLWRAAQSSAAA